MGQSTRAALPWTRWTGRYRSGGLISALIRPLYDPRLADALYDWVGYGKLHLVTYTPFAAITSAHLVSAVVLSQQRGGSGKS